MTPDELKELRTNHKLSQPEMGRILGYTGNYIYRLENGKERITQRFEKLVVAVFGEKKVKKSPSMS